MTTKRTKTAHTAARGNRRRPIARKIARAGSTPPGDGHTTSKPMLIGYARVSTVDQNLALQRDARVREELGRTNENVAAIARTQVSMQRDIRTIQRDLADLKDRVTVLTVAVDDRPPAHVWGKQSENAPQQQQENNQESADAKGTFGWQVPATLIYAKPDLALLDQIVKKLIHNRTSGTPAPLAPDGGAQGPNYLASLMGFCLSRLPTSDFKTCIGLHLVSALTK